MSTENFENQILNLFSLMPAVLDGSSWDNMNQMYKELTKEKLSILLHHYTDKGITKITVLEAYLGMSWS